MVNLESPKFSALCSIFKTEGKYTKKTKRIIFPNDIGIGGNGQKKLP